MTNESTLPTEATQKTLSRDGLIWRLLAWLAYAVLLGFAIFHHQMWSDELQAFLIARDSGSIAELFKNLRYEGHPALWYLLLMIPSHISWNPAGMQILNYLLALTEAWLILSVRELKLIVRILLIFSFTLFYTDGTLARSYMLAVLLLTAAVLSYSPKHKVNYLTILFLALAIQTHFFAIPIAILFAVWLFFSELGSDLGNGFKRFRGFEVICATIILLVSTFLAYLTIRPPSDEYLPHYGKIDYSIGHNFLVSLSGVWAGVFIPYPLIHASSFPSATLPDKDHAPLLSIFLSLLCLVLATLILRTRRARLFFVLTCFAEIVVFAITVHLPDLRHYGMLFAAFLLALLLNFRSRTAPNARLLLKPAASFALLLSFLTLQATYGLYAAAREWTRPYSNAHDAALWLRANHLEQAPILIVGASGPSIVGYLERASVFYSACDCEGSFYKYARNWDYERPVTADELVRLDSLNQSSNHPPTIIISSHKFADTELESLHIREVKEFSSEVVSGNERYFIYQQISQ